MHDDMMILVLGWKESGKEEPMKKERGEYQRNRKRGKEGLWWMRYRYFQMRHLSSILK
jgi:hypothetical protein